MLTSRCFNDIDSPLLITTHCVACPGRPYIYTVQTAPEFSKRFRARNVSGSKNGRIVRYDEPVAISGFSTQLAVLLATLLSGANITDNTNVHLFLFDDLSVSGDYCHIRIVHMLFSRCFVTIVIFIDS